MNKNFSSIEYIETLEKNTKIENFKFRNAQKHALEMMQKYEFGIVDATCAIGKSYIEASQAYYEFITAKKDEYKVVIVISPRLLLNKQLVDDFNDLYDFDKLEVDIRNLSSDTRSAGQINFHSLKELIENKTNHILIFTTPKSLELYNKEFWNLFSNNKVDCILWDEAHKEATKNLREYIKNCSKRAYFCTATPDEKLKNYTGFGYYQYTFLEALSDELVVDFETYLLDTKMKIGNNEAAYQYYAIKEAFLHNKAIRPNEPSIVLACTNAIEHADAVMKKILEDKRQNTWSKDIDIYCVISAKKKEQINGCTKNGINISKEEILNELKEKNPNKDRIIIHVCMIQEGISINSINAVIIFGNKSDENLYQTIMRGARLNPETNKKDFRVYYAIGEDTDITTIEIFCKKLYRINPSLTFHFGLNKDELRGTAENSESDKIREIKMNKKFIIIQNKLETDWKPNYKKIQLEKEIRMAIVDKLPIMVLQEYLTMHINKLKEANMTTNELAEICEL